MRKITQQSAEAFNANRAFKKQNMEVTTYNDKTCLWLHGNCIATKENNVLTIDACHWLTNTTKERLNALPGVNIHQRNFVWYLNGKEWNGARIKVN